VYYACQQDCRIPFTRLRRQNHTSAAAGAHGFDHTVGNAHLAPAQTEGSVEKLPH
ncbi:hypothetical protein JOQ06_003951, partial [Pogonophryne albipinna]